jgi:hypothetical protein
LEEKNISRLLAKSWPSAEKKGLHKISLRVAGLYIAMMKSTNAKTNSF